MSDKQIHISIWLPRLGFTPAGTARFSEAHGYAGFSYFPEYLEADHPPLNPATLNWRDTGSRHFVVDPRLNREMLDRTFWELLPSRGDFGESLLVSRHPQYHSMCAAQRLHFLGSRSVGGLRCHVRREADEQSVDTPEWLDSVRRESVAFHLRELSRLSDWRAIEALTSYGGVRPKAMYQDREGRRWIAKFNLPAPIDPYDMARAEHAAMRMAAACGLRVPETRVLELPSGESVFLTERFDRPGGERAHSLSLFALAPGVEHERPPALPGAARSNLSGFMAAIVRRFSDFKDADTANLVLKLLVDVGFNNTDNHLRNTRLLLNPNGLWELSPLFDVLFNPRSQPHVYSPAGVPLDQTCLDSDAMVEGMARQIGVDPALVAASRDKVRAVALDWETHCRAAGMGEPDMARIEAAIRLGVSRVELERRFAVERRAKIEALRQAPRPPRPA